MSKARIGFVGVGLMGHGIAKNLIAKGYPVTLRLHRNRAAADDLLKAGATEVASYAALAQGSDIVILCVTGAPQVRGSRARRRGDRERRAPGADRHRHVDERAGDDDPDARSARGRRASASSMRRSRARRSRPSRAGSTSWSARTTRRSAS